jgi:hypothetical protein
LSTSKKEKNGTMVADEKSNIDREELRHFLCSQLMFKAETYYFTPGSLISDHKVKYNKADTYFSTNEM